MSSVDAGGVQQRIVESGGSAFQRYRAAATGRAGIFGFLTYELLTVLMMPLPGRFGAFLRRVFYRPLFASMGRRVTIGRNVVFRRPGQIAVGDDVVIGHDAILDAKADDSVIELEESVQLGARTILSCNGGDMRLGARTRVGACSRLGSLRGLEIGADVTLGEACCLSGAGHAFTRRDVPIIMQPLTCRGRTRLGRRVRIGDRATLRDGVSVGEGAQIDAAAFVSEDVPPGARVRGVPARAGTA